jgi:uncharacterized protein (TIGR02453 family)
MFFAGEEKENLTICDAVCCLPMTFPGFSAEAMKFFRGIKRNNDRDWFQKRKHVFEEHVKRPMIELVSGLHEEMMRFAPEYVDEPGKAIYRFYRDTRFSADKKPYKDRIAASFHRRGLSRHGCAGFYFSVSGSAVEIGGGVYMPAPGELAAIRAHLADKHREFRRIASNPELRRLMGEVEGERLQRVPKGYDAVHPAADLLRYKQILLFKVMDGDLATSPRLAGEVVKRFRAMAPFIKFLNAPLIGSRPQNETRGLPALNSR